MTLTPAHPRTAVRVLLTALLLAACQLLPVGPASATITQGIQGVVTGPDGPVSRVIAQAISEGGEVNQLVYTAADGSYELALPPGRYLVRFAPDNSPGLAPEYWVDSPTKEGATLVDVAEGSTVTASPSLSAYGYITGKVTDAAGAVLREAEVDAFVDGVYGSYAPSDTDGTFRVRVAPSTYTVRFSKWRYATEWYDDTAQATAQEVVVPGGQEVDLGTVVLQRQAVATTRPSIGGATGIGATVTINPGTWDPADAALTFQWTRDGEPIAGATARTYVVADADTGHELGATVTGTAPGFVTGTFATPYPMYVDGTPAPPVVNKTAPVISGEAKVGMLLTTDGGTWETAGVTRKFQWFRGEAPIVGAINDWYIVTADDLAQPLTVLVTGTRESYYAATTVASAPTAPVAKNTMVVRDVPAIAGIAQVGRVLTRSLGTWEWGVDSYTTQWLRNGLPITGATGPSYTLTAADAGRVIRVRVMAHRAGFTSGSAMSAPTAAVANANFVVTRAASIAGTLRVGYVLTANAPLTSPASAAIRYQWLRNGTAISGAVYRTYRLTKYDKGKRMSVRITLTRPGYNPLVRTVQRAGFVA